MATATRKASMKGRSSGGTAAKAAPKSPPKGRKGKATTKRQNKRAG